MATVPYFIAMKLEAFADRGGGDFTTSHDIEDIVAVVNGHAAVNEKIEQSDTLLREHLAQADVGAHASCIRALNTPNAAASLVPKSRPQTPVIPAGYVTCMARSYLVLDIETIPDTSLYEPPPLEAGVEKPFPPHYAHQVVVLGVMWLDQNYAIRKLGIIGENKDETGILTDFSEFVSKYSPDLVTYNGRSFDLPVMALRALRAGVPMPWYYAGRLRYRFSEDGHLDLCDVLSDYGAARSMKLDALARLIGLPGKVGVDGSQVEGLFHAGQTEAIKSYCLADVAQTALLFLRYRLLQGAISPDQYRSITTEWMTEMRADERLTVLVEAIDGKRLLLAA